MGGSLRRASVTSTIASSMTTPNLSLSNRQNLITYSSFQSGLNMERFNAARRSI
jgi:uncharacterized protein YpbB